MPASSSAATRRPHGIIVIESARGSCGRRRRSDSKRSPELLAIGTRRTNGPTTSLERVSTSSVLRSSGK